MINEEQLLQTWKAFRWRYMDRDVRYHKLDQVLKGDWMVQDEDGEKIESRSPNLIKVALEDTSEAASQVPTVRVMPRRSNPSSKKTAALMEYIAQGYFDVAQMELLVPQLVTDLAAWGLMVAVVWPDFDERLPVIERRDPRYCYPEPGLRPGQRARRVFFSHKVHFSQLPPEWQDLLRPHLEDERGWMAKERQQINLLEYFSEDEFVTAGVITINPSSPGYGFGPAGDDPTEVPVILERVPNRTGVCQAVVELRFSHDEENRGQFDQVIGVLEAHVRLMGLLLDYSDQAVYSDIWVKDLIGEMAWGGGAYIELGPQGAIGRVPPAVSSMNVQQDLENIVDAFHVGARWPKARPGEIDQAIASAKFLEATAGMMNTQIKTYHQLIADACEHLLRVAFLTDQKYFPGPKAATGILRNQEFIEEYDASKDIDIKHKIRAEYGLGLGRDPSQSAVLMIQYAQNDYISHEFVQENIEGLTDVNRERIRIDTEKLRQMMFAQLLTGLQQGTIPHEALVNIHDARERGEEIAQLYRKYIIEPASQTAGPAAGPDAAGPGLPGMPPGPGGAPAGPGGAPPGPPGVPTPPPPDQLLQQINLPAGPGGSIGVRPGVGR